jgi:hypothetical protein
LSLRLFRSPALPKSRDRLNESTFALTEKSQGRKQIVFAAKSKIPRNFNVNCTGT